MLRLTLDSTPRCFDSNRFIPQHRSTPAKRSALPTTQVFGATVRAPHVDSNVSRRETQNGAKRSQGARYRISRTLGGACADQARDHSQEASRENCTSRS